MTLTVQRLGELAAHALGAQSEIEPVELVNMAGEAWVNAHPWQYLNRRSKTLDVTASQGYVDLGDEVRNVISMAPSSALSNYVEWTTLEEINRLRTSITGTHSTGYWAAVSYRRDATAGELHQIAELWPTPASTSAGYFTLFYQSGWLSVSDDDDKVDLPSWLEPVFIQWVRNYAEGLEDSDLGQVEQRLEMLLGSQLMQRAMARDGAMLNDLGQPMGGAAQPGRQDIARIYFVDSVATPGS